MARVFPFTPYRYTPTAGSLENLVTQPYDKISAAMRERYLTLSPYNLVRVILPEGDYAGAARRFCEWISAGVLARDEEPGLYAYFQEFREPDSGERLLRKGFIGLGAVEEYGAGVVFRHEQTLTGPKQDRLQLLRHTRAHFGQIFMLYPDPAGAVDTVLEETARQAPDAEVTDEYGVRHTLWRIPQPGRIQRLMADKKLLIADGHHRYETAVAFRKECPQADKVMMTFVNMHSPGLRILATHRLVSGIENFDSERFLRIASEQFRIEEVNELDRGIGAAIGERLYRLECQQPGDALDVALLHERLLEGVLGITAEAVRQERNVKYVRGLDAARAAARRGEAQIAFLLRPVSVAQVAGIAFGGGVMPQKSTDFYPKLLSGLAIYRLE